MREIKFRAWDKKQKIMGFNFFICQNEIINFVTTGEKDCVKISKCNKNNVVAMQFTGLKDKKGKEIYEGDILYIKHKRGKYWSKGKVLVCWADCEFYADKIDESVIEDEESLGNYSYGFDIEVIGNKFENPELLDALGRKEE